QRAKEEEHESYVFCILKRIHVKTELRFRDVCVFLGRDFLITVHSGEADLIDRIAKKVVVESDTRLDRIFYNIVDALVDEYLPILDASSERISDIETQVLANPEPQLLRNIFNLKRKLLNFRRIVS